jgi:hypothetical protein
VLHFIPVIELGACFGNGNYALVVADGLVENCTKGLMKENENVSGWVSLNTIIEFFLYSSIKKLKFRILKKLV